MLLIETSHASSKYIAFRHSSTLPAMLVYSPCSDCITPFNFLLSLLVFNLSDSQKYYSTLMPGTIIYRKQKARWKERREKNFCWTVFCQFSVPSFAIEIFFFCCYFRFSVNTFFKRKSIESNDISMTRKCHTCTYNIVWRKSRRNINLRGRRRNRYIVHWHTQAGSRGRKSDGKISDGIICSYNLHLIIPKKNNFMLFYISTHHHPSPSSSYDWRTHHRQESRCLIVFVRTNVRTEIVNN